MKVFQSKVVDEAPKEQPDEQRPMEGAEVDQENKLVKWKGYPSEDITCNLSSAQAAIKALEERQLEGPGKPTDSAESEPGTEAMDEAGVVDTASAQLPSDAAGKPSNDTAGVAPRGRGSHGMGRWTEGEKEQSVGLVRENGPGMAMAMQKKEAKLKAAGESTEPNACSPISRNRSCNHCRLLTCLCLPRLQFPRAKASNLRRLTTAMTAAAAAVRAAAAAVEAARL